MALSDRSTSLLRKDANGNVFWRETHVYDAFNRRIAFYEDPDGPLGPEPERLTFVLHDLAQPPTAEQVSQGGLAPYVDGVYGSAAFAANPVADFTDGDTSDGITPALTDRRLYGAGVDDLLAHAEVTGLVDHAVTDLLGSLRKWVRTDGSVLASYEYSSYGTAAVGAQLEGSRRFGFTGRAASHGGNAWFARACTYDPAPGRFLQADPARALLGGIRPPANSYAYVRNSPTNQRDPTGLVIEYAGPQEAVEEFKRLVEEAKRESEVFRQLLQELENSDQRVTIRVVEGNDGVPVDEFASGTIDVGDLRELAARPVPKYGMHVVEILTHFFAEQRYKLKSEKDRYDKAHREAMKVQNRVRRELKKPPLASRHHWPVRDDKQKNKYYLCWQYDFRVAGMKPYVISR